MVGLLGNNSSGGLLARNPGNRGATPEAMRRKMEEDARRAALLAAAPQAAPQPERQPAQQRGPGFLTYLLGGSEGMERARRAPLEREMMEQRIRAQRQLADMFGPGPASADGPPAVGGQPAPAQPARRGLPSYAEAAPALIAAELAGVDGVAGIRSTLSDLRPDIQIGPDGRPFNKHDPAVLDQTFANRTNINGFIADLNNPENEGRYFPDLEPGQTPLYDREGNVVAVRNLDGAVQAVGERTRAVADANNASEASYAGAIAGSTAAGQAPYQIETVQGPDGRPIVTSRANILAQGGITGQSPAEQAAAVDLAKGEAARANELADTVREDTSQAPVLQEALGLLPDVITGFGADMRLQAARARAAMGDDDARRRVEATETFRSVMGQRVLAVARQLGTGSGVTDSDRKFAQDIAGGNIELNEGSIRRLLRIEQEAAARRRGQGPRPIAQDAQGNRVQWNGSAWVPIR